VNEAGGVQLFYLNETVAHQEEIRKEA
jgi:hypothetical protein